MNQHHTLGHTHPIILLIDEITAIFTDMGFSVAEGRELVSENDNFDVLNFPKDHPARDMQDTFYIDTNKTSGTNRLLRTQTSSVQVPYMKEAILPIQMIVPGKVFRNESTDATHEMQFFQLEGMVINKTANVADLKKTLEDFLTKVFKKEAEIRMRPSFFPFVEPGYEVDMNCFKCGGQTDICSVCKGSGWIEILGAGMIHPNVLRAGGIDPRLYQGFAFGCGIDRIAMLKWGIDDVRLLYNGDVRVVAQF
ncbi:MAG: phenylalanyl-tRNA synthetase subunit alpha, phenylalanyl-tRNA synthetase alpha chain [Candidatus Parcubacteria bacterium]|jgi:phenylalanyl-tRNA synthetase alpha chain